MANVLVDKEQLEQLMTLCEEQQKRLDEFDATEVYEITIPGLNPTPTDDEILAKVGEVDEETTELPSDIDEFINPKN